jgi:hypothetical protein
MRILPSARDKARLRAAAQRPTAPSGGRFCNGANSGDF